MSLIQSRMIGDVRVTRVLESATPSQPPEQLFAGVPAEELRAELARAAHWLAPHHYVPTLNGLVITIQFFIVQAADAVILIDTGIGNGKTRAVPGMDRLNTPTLEWLSAAGAAPAQVTHVLHTHLHVDHVGWNTVWRDGAWMPTFPNARTLIPRGEFMHWNGLYESGDTGVNLGSFADSVLPVVAAGGVELIDDGFELAGCLTAEAAPGHAPGMFSYRLRSRGAEALFAGDALHSPIQIANPHWNDAYCSDPAAAAASRRLVLERAAERQAVLIPFHFGAPYAALVTRNGDGFAYAPSAWA
jgi:glyoxylase-like metal-dependent hydrolase (beta-lactamase superfamily II)